MPDPGELSPEEIRSFLKDNVTVVAPGETLVVRVSGFTPEQLREYSNALNWCDPDGNAFLPFRVLVVEGSELGVVPGGQDFTARVADAISALGPVVGVDGRVRAHYQAPQ